MSKMVVRERAAPYGERTRPPRSRVPKRMTEDEFVDWYWKTDDNVQAEWVAGEVIMMSPDNLKNNKNEGLIYCVMCDFVGIKDLGEVFHSRVQMRLPIKPSRREPDILFVAKERLQILRETFIDGPADFAMEIVSPESEKRDKTTKYYEYEAAGIKEYWIVHVLDGTISAFTLNSDGKYEPIPMVDGVVRSKVISGFYWRREWILNSKAMLATTILKEMGAI
ncbi:MAG TPA: Uma2 family endonuclease [Planctomycetota bacterium]|nr:Uma2 family endonuclease [Planctomycetota bacterium]